MERKIAFVSPFDLARNFCSRRRAIALVRGSMPLLLALGALSCSTTSATKGGFDSGGLRNAQTRERREANCSSEESKLLFVDLGCSSNIDTDNTDTDAQPLEKPISNEIHTGATKGTTTSVIKNPLGFVPENEDIIPADEGHAAIPAEKIRAHAQPAREIANGRKDRKTTSQTPLQADSVRLIHAPVLSIARPEPGQTRREKCAEEQKKLGVIDLHCDRLSND